MRSWFFAWSAAVLALVLGSCASPQPQTHQAAHFEGAPNAIDQKADPSIEEYILALPPYRFHHESAVDFAARVHAARQLPQNAGKGPDYLFITGDGIWPDREFVLERSARTLVVHALATQIRKGGVVSMQRVPEGWMMERRSEAATNPPTHS